MNADERAAMDAREVNGRGRARHAMRWRRTINAVLLAGRGRGGARLGREPPQRRERPGCGRCVAVDDVPVGDRLLGAEA